MIILSIINNFVKRRKFVYLFPKKIRFFIFNLKFLKKFKTKTGNYYLPLFAFKDGIRNRIIDDEITDKLVFDEIAKFIQPNSIVLDLGANYGQMSILWSKYKPDVTVYAFEASKYIYDILKKNILENSANVKPFNCLIGNKSKNKTYIKKSFLSNNMAYGSNKIEKVSNFKIKNFDQIKSLKIDDLNFKKKISVMKIDVQGYDLDALKGAKKTILKNKMPIIFEYEAKFEKEFKYTFLDFEIFISEINYKIAKQLDPINYLIVPINFIEEINHKW